MDWVEGLLDVENPNANTNPSLEKTPTPKNGRKPLAGWVKHRRRTVQAAEENKRNVVIDNAKSIPQEEFNSNNCV